MRIVDLVVLWKEESWINLLLKISVSVIKDDFRGCVCSVVQDFLLPCPP